MKFKICLILVFLFSFCSNNAKAYVALNNLYLENMEEQLSDDFIFQENGVRSVYRSNAQKQDKIDEVKEDLELKFNKKVEVKDDEIDIGTSLGDIDITFLSKDEDTIVCLTIINHNKDITISKLMKELTELQGKNIFDIRYFQYIKGKINNIDDRLVKIKNLHQISKIDTLDIHNGYVGTANINNGGRVNIALNKPHA